MTRKMFFILRNVDCRKEEKKLFEGYVCGKYSVLRKKLRVIWFYYMANNLTIWETNKLVK